MILEVIKTRESQSPADTPYMSYNYVKSLADECFKNASSSR